MARPIRRTKTRKELHRPNGIIEIWDKKGLFGLEDWSGGKLRRVKKRTKSKPITREQYSKFINKR